MEQLAAENARLAGMREGPGGLHAKAEAATAELAQTRATLARVREDFERTRERVETLGLGRAGGLLLVAKQGRLPALADLARKKLRRGRELRQAQVDELRLVTQRASIAGRLDDEVASIVARLHPPPGDEPATRAQVRETLETRLALLDGLIADTDRYLTLLFDLDTAEEELSNETLRYERYVSERLLWIPTDTVLDPRQILGSSQAFVWLVDPRAWRAAAVASGRYLAEHPVPTLLLSALLAALALFRLRARAFPGVAPRSGVWLGTVLVRSVALVGFVPAALWSAGWVLTSAPDVPPVARSIGGALDRIGSIVLVIELLLATFRAGGIGQTLLGWTPAESAELRRSCRLLRPVFVPAAVLGLACIAQFRETGDRALSGAGRLAVLFALGVLFLAVRRVLHPARGVIATRIAAHAGGWPARLRPLSYWGALLFLSGSTLLVVLGYGQATGALIDAAFASLAVLLLAGILQGIARFWVSRTDDDAQAHPPDSLLRRIRAALVLSAGVALLVVWSKVIPALLYLDSIRLWSVESPEGPRDVTVASLLFVVALLAATVVAVRAAPAILESVLSRLGSDKSVRYASGMVAQYVLFIVGVVLAFGQLRIGWSKVQWLVAGLSVGVGFGLQEIVANFISGVTLLFERPIRIGDTVTVGETTGTVTAIHVRATTIQDFDRKTLIVPNKELITTRVTNWDLGNPMLRTQLEVGVAYGSDTAKVAELLLHAARECKLVLASPPPQAILSEFGPSALLFRLYVFLPNRDVILEARHALHTAIAQVLREAGITIAFPQLDVHLDPAPGPAAPDQH